MTICQCARSANEEAEVFSSRSDSDDFCCACACAAIQTRLGVCFRSGHIDNTSQSSLKNIFGIIFIWLLRFHMFLFIYLFIFLSLFKSPPPFKFWCDAYLCAPWVYSHQLFATVYFQINSVCKSIHACNYCRLRDRSMDPPENQKYGQSVCSCLCALVRVCACVCVRVRVLFTDDFKKHQPCKKDARAWYCAPDWKQDRPTHNFKLF